MFTFYYILNSSTVEQNSHSLYTSSLTTCLGFLFHHTLYFIILFAHFLLLLYYTLQPSTLCCFSYSSLCYFLLALTSIFSHVPNLAKSPFFPRITPQLWPQPCATTFSLRPTTLATLHNFVGGAPPRDLESAHKNKYD